MNEPIPTPESIQGALQMLKDQMLIVMLKRLLNNQPGTVSFPVVEVDDTGGWGCELKMDHESQSFRFNLHKKQ